VTPDAVLITGSFSVLSRAKVACDVTGDQWWQLNECEGKCKGEERKSDTEIGNPDRGSLLGPVRLQQRNRERVEFLRLNLSAAQDQGTSQNRSQCCAEGVESLGKV
jgi:hypothetical protein